MFGVNILYVLIMVLDLDINVLEIVWKGVYLVDWIEKFLFECLCKFFLCGIGN